MINASIRLDYTLGSVVLHSTQTALEFEETVERDVIVPDGTTNQAVDPYQMTAASLKLVLWESDKDVTIHTNTTGGSQTIALKAGIPLFWQKDCGFACPITVDVTKLYITNAEVGASQANVSLRHGSA